MTTPTKTQEERREGSDTIIESTETVLPDVLPDFQVTSDPPKKKPVKQVGLLQDILSLLIKIFAVLTILGLLFTFLFGILSVRDIAMKPSIQDGDIVVFYRLNKDYVASDVLVLEYEGQKQVRRVIATAGDTVDIKEEGLYINGSLIMEQGAQEIMLYDNGVTFPITLGEGQVFVLGDNRKGTIDSRMYGAVNIKDTLGKVITVIRQRNI